MRWTGFEFEYREKTTDWFWAVGIIVGSSAIVCFIYGNTIFGLFLIIAGATMIINGAKPPELVDYELTQKGLRINNKIYNYEDFEAFYVLDDGFRAPKLLLRTRRIVNPILIITIETDYVDTEDVRSFLLDYIPEEEMHEPATVRIMEIIGF